MALDTPDEAALLESRPIEEELKAGLILACSPDFCDSGWVLRKGRMKEKYRCTPNKNPPTYSSVSLCYPALAGQDWNMSYSE